MKARAGKTWVTALTALVISAGASARSWFDDDPPSTVQDLRYGVALYQHYQDKNLEALAELMVAEANGGIQGHGDNPEIMKGGFYLAYGMKYSAGSIFERLLDQNRPVRTRDAAWYFLARLHYLQKDFWGAEENLALLSDSPVKRLATESDVLRFNIAVQTQNYDEAIQLMKADTLKNSDWLPYLYYNLGAAYSREQRWRDAAKTFAVLTNMRERSDEHLALYDKAMTAEGYANLFNDNFRGAIRGFKKVRLESPLASRALLGYGWAAYELEDYNQALQPWQVLAKRAVVDENVQEAWIAIPTVYEKLGYASVALEQYRTAEAAYEQEIARLDQTIESLEGNAIRQALNIDRSRDFDWLDYAKTNAMEPELVYLIRLFSQDRFLRNVQELRDLLAIQTNLQEWQTKLTLYRAMLDEREANRAQELDYLQQEGIADKIKALEAALEAQTNTIARLRENNDFLSLVAAHEIPRRDRILNAEANARRLAQGGKLTNLAITPEDLETLTQTLRIHKGVLIWQAAEMSEVRLKHAQTIADDIFETLAEIQATHKRVVNIVSRGLDLAPYRAQITEAESKLTWQLTSTELAILTQQDALRDQVRGTLQEERDRLVHYLGQARLATARILDAASQDIMNTDPKATPAEETGNSDKGKKGDAPINQNPPISAEETGETNTEVMDTPPSAADRDADNHSTSSEEAPNA